MKKALLLMLGAMLFISCGEKKDPAAETRAKNIEAFKGFDAAMQSGKLNDLDKYCDANFIEHTPAPGQKPGLAGLKEMYPQWKAAWPDMKWEYTTIAADGDYVLAHYRMSGTNTGPFMGMPPTNKKMDITGVDVTKFKDGKGIEHWSYMEEMKMMTQMGLMDPSKMMPPPDAAAAPPTPDAKAPEAKK